jgi:CubicO group peptidase (beta-lactamase class C family)
LHGTFKGLAMPSRVRAAALVAVAVLSAAGASASPTFRPDGPHGEAYGVSEGYPVWAVQPGRMPFRFMVGTFSHYDQFLPARTVAKGEAASALRRAEQDVPATYTYDRARRTLADYVDRNPVTGLLIAKGDTILFEHYQYGRTEHDRFVSHSMAKTVTAMLIGIAMSEGKIASIDDPVSKYVAEFAGSEYGGTSLRALLTMSSGVQFREDYDGADDISRLSRDLFGPRSPGTAAAVRQFNTRLGPVDTVFRYASAETEILGLVLRAVVGMSVSEYLSSRIWQPLGAEADATWTIDRSGQEATYCCLTARLRDYARVGLMLANSGAWNGKQIVPRDWVLEVTTASPERAHLLPGKATPFFGYGYQTWLLPGPRRMFALLGIHGQAIFVDPAAKLVMVHTAVRPIASNDPGGRETVALWTALVEQLGGE